MEHETWWLLVMGGVGLIWQDSMRARERALAAAKGTCAQLGLDLLDDTVALTHLGVVRNRQGRLCLRRIYAFEYLRGDPARRRATLIYHGGQLESLLLEPSPPDPAPPAE